MTRKQKNQLKQLKEINKDINKKVLVQFIGIISIIIFCILILLLMNKYNLNNKKYYKASDFNIKTIYSKNDKDKDNIDDYTDILLGAQNQIRKEITDTELLKLSLENAGYYIEDNIIDYIKDNSEELTINWYEISYFQPGDIIIYNDNKIGIVSEKRNEEGLSYLIYVDNNVKENDVLNDINIINHYRLKN